MAENALAGTQQIEAAKAKSPKPFEELFKHFKINQQ
jgi:hypothetical protein